MTQAQKQSQAILFVMILMMIVGLFGTLLMNMWGNEADIRSMDIQSLRAFYLAQAGIERAKIDVSRTMTLCSLTTSWFNDLDDAMDNFTFRYGYRISCADPADACPPNGAPLYCNDDRRVLVGVGEVQDSGGVILSHRETQVEVQGLRDNDADGDDDPTNNNTETNDTWEEL